MAPLKGLVRVCEKASNTSACCSALWTSCGRKSGAQPSSLTALVITVISAFLFVCLFICLFVIYVTWCGLLLVRRSCEDLAEVEAVVRAVVAMDPTLAAAMVRN